MHRSRDKTAEYPRPDEDELVIPESWRERVHPRRDGHVRPEAEADMSAAGRVRERVQLARDRIESILAHGDSEPELADRVRRYLNGEADPAGAAVLAEILVVGMDAWRQEVFVDFVDAWAAEHGVAFAADAMMELGGIACEQIRVRRLERGFACGWWWEQEAMRRLRTLLAVSDERDFLAAVERLADHRRASSHQVFVSYLVPTRRDWVDEVLAGLTGRPLSTDREAMLWCAVGTAEQVARLGGHSTVNRASGFLSLLGTVVDGVGPAIAPELAEAFDREADDTDRRPFAEALSVIPTDEALELLIARLGHKHVVPVMPAVMERFPVRALRLLAAAASGTSRNAALVSDLLTGHVLANPELTAEVLPELSGSARKVVEAVLVANARVAEAPEDALPALLVEPPWTRRRKVRKPVVITGLTPPDERALVWAPGERQAWSDCAPKERHFPDGTDWAREIELIRSDLRERPTTPFVLLEGPEELIRPLLAEGARDTGPEIWDHYDHMWRRAVVARHGLTALPWAMRAAWRQPPVWGRLLLPYLDAEVAWLMVDWLARLKSVRRIAIAWFGRHGAAAARLLVPATLGLTGRERRDAEGALRHIAANFGTEEVIAAARPHGEEAVSAIEALLATDPLDILPGRPPKVGDWADPAALPQVLVRGRARALPAASAGHLITMLAMSRPGDVYAGVDVVRELCDPGSLAAFGWSLFRRWQLHGAPPKDGWALTQLGWIGNDETVRRLASVIRAWPGEGGHARAATGLDTLAAIGSDVALMHLYDISERMKFKGLKARAREKIDDVAADRGLTPERLADRMVPDFGLDARGGMMLDYGPRRFVVGFDERLMPYVMDEDGQRRKTLPRPGAKDDLTLAPVAHARFADLRKEVRLVAAAQISRLESAMVARRRWTPAEFHDLFATHPLLWHIARRLVWLAEDGGEITAFRLTEDRTLADVDDDVFTAPEPADIGLAHPIDLGDRLGDWSRLFDDYELTQPFPQLGRAVYGLTGEERGSGRLTVFEGRVVPFGRVLGLRRRGWHLDDEGIVVDGWIARQVAADRFVVVNVAAVHSRHTDEITEQRLEHVWVGDRPGDFSPERAGSVRFGELHPAIVSEVLADLTRLSEPAP